MLRSGRFALSLVCIVLLTLAVVPAWAEDTYWQHEPTTAGDWFAPANWTAGVPGSADSAIIDNGGTADISSGQATAKYVRVGYDNNTGTMTHAGGDLVVKEDISIGLYSGAVGTYIMSGDARLSANGLFVGHDGGVGHFIQTGGTNEALQIIGPGYYELSGTGVINSNGLSVGSFMQTGGTVNLVYGISVGTYELSGTGQIYAKDETFSAYGGAIMNQTGGTNTVTGTIRLGDQGSYQGTYNLSGTGELTVAEMYVGSGGGTGLFQQSGGTATVGYLSVDDWNTPSRVELSGGLLRISQAMFLKGDLDFTADGGTFEAAEDAFVDLSQGNIHNPGNGSILGGLNSLIIFPTGFDPSGLKSYSTAGLTHIAGETLVVPAGKKVTGRGKIDDHVICQGQISTHEGASLSLKSGLEVSNGGTVDLGDYGVLTVEDSTSGISGGSLSCDEVTIGKEGTGKFTQSGSSSSVLISGWTLAGGLTLGQYENSYGTYEMQDGLFSVGCLTVGYCGKGGFVQTGGTSEAQSIYVGYSGSSEGTFELRGGQLTAKSEVFEYGDSRFIQTGGNNTVGYLYVRNADSLYELNGGQLSAGLESINSSGVVKQSSGENLVRWLKIRSGGRFEYTGGTLSIGGLTIDGGELDFTGKTATVQAMDGAVLDFRLIGPGTIKNAENISFVAGTNSLTIIESGFDPGSLFGNYTTTGLVHTVGDILDVPSGVSLVFSHGDVNDTIDFDDHVRCSGSITVGGDSYYKGLDLNDGLEISNGGTVDLGSGHVFVNDLVSGISSGQLSNRNHARLWIGLTQDGKFTQTGGTVSVVDLYLGGNGNSGAYYLIDGELEAVAETVGQSDSPADFYQSGGTNTFDSLSLKGSPYQLPNATYTLSGNALMNGRALAVGVGSYTTNRTSFYHQNGTVNLEILTVAGGTYTFDSGSLTADDETIRGIFYHNGGTNKITDTLTVQGRYYLYDGELYADTESLKGGSIVQAGGSNTVQSDLNVAEDGNSTYELKAGALSAENETIGVVWGTGKFVQSGGTNTVNSTLRLGKSNQAHGIYELKAGNLIAHTVEVGYGYIQYPGNTGMFEHTDGTHMISGGLFLGCESGSSGTYDLISGDLSAEQVGVGVRGLGLFEQSGGTNTIRDSLCLGCESGSSGTYNLSGTCLLSARREQIGFDGDGLFSQTRGTNEVRLLEIGPRGRYEYTGGDLIAGGIRIEGQFDFAGTTQVFIFAEGVLDVSKGQFIGADNAVLCIGSNAVLIMADGYDPSNVFNYYINQGLTHIAGNDLIIPADRTIVGSGIIDDPVLVQGRLAVGENDPMHLGDCLEIWNGGTLDIADATAEVTVSNRLMFREGGSFTAAVGATIHMTGSAFENQSTDPDALSGLGNLTLIFEGGSEDIDPFEVAGEDMGAAMAGLESNFALGTLQLGGDDIGQLKLVDAFDNRPDWTGDEAMYVENLILGAGSTLDLNGLNLYYLNFTDYGGSVTGGTPTQVPEPTAMLLLALGGLAMLKRRR